MNEPSYFGLTNDHTWLSVDEEYYKKLKPTHRMKCYTHPAELTDEEIYACFHQYFVLGEPKPTHYELEYEDLIDFARAILRKAQEK